MDIENINNINIDMMDKTMNIEEDENRNTNIDNDKNEQLMNLEDDKDNQDKMDCDEENIVNQPVLNYPVPIPEPGRKKATDINYLKWRSDDENIEQEVDPEKEQEETTNFIFKYFNNEYLIKQRRNYKKVLQIIKEMVERKITEILRTYQISSFPIAKTNVTIQIKSFFDMDKIDEEKHPSFSRLIQLAYSYIDISKRITKKNKDKIKHEKNKINQNIYYLEENNFDELISSLHHFILPSEEEPGIDENDTLLDENGNIINKKGERVDKKDILISIPSYNLDTKFDDNLILEDTRFGVKYIRQYGISKTPSSKKNIKDLLKRMEQEDHKQWLEQFVNNYEEVQKDTKRVTNSSFVSQYLYQYYKNFTPWTETFRFTETNEGPHVRKRILDENEQLLEIDTKIANDLYKILAKLITTYEMIKQLIYRFRIDEVEEDLSIEKLNIPFVSLSKSLCEDLYYENVYKYFVANKFMFLYDKEGYELKQEFYRKKIEKKNMEQRIISSVIDKNGKLNKKGTKKFIVVELELKNNDTLKNILGYLYNIDLKEKDSLKFRVGIALVDKQQNMTQYQLSQIIHYAIFSDTDNSLFNISSENVNELYGLIQKLCKNFDETADKFKDKLTKKYYKLFVSPIPPNKSVSGNISRYIIRQNL